MLIKGTTRRGDAIPLTAKEALKHAVGRLCKFLNTRETIYWVDQRSIKETMFKSLADKDGVWEAWAEGTADIGFTDAKTNLFHKPRPHTFKVNYKLDKDEWGIPDIAIVGTPEISPIERNPAKLAGPMPDPTIRIQVPEKASKKAKVVEEQTK